MLQHGVAVNGKEKPERFLAVRCWQYPYFPTSASDLIDLGGFSPLLSLLCKECYLRMAGQQCREMAVGIAATWSNGLN